MVFWSVCTEQHHPVEEETLHKRGVQMDGPQQLRRDNQVPVSDHTELMHTTLICNQPAAEQILHKHNNALFMVAPIVLVKLKSSTSETLSLSAPNNAISLRPIQYNHCWIVSLKKSLESNQKRLKIARACTAFCLRTDVYLTEKKVVNSKSSNSYARLIGSMRYPSQSSKRRPNSGWTSFPPRYPTWRHAIRTLLPIRPVRPLRPQPRREVKAAQMVCACVSASSFPQPPFCLASFVSSRSCQLCSAWSTIQH